MSKPRGAFCPDCRGVRLHCYRTERAVAGRTDRYRECSACGLRMVFSETLTRLVRRSRPGK